MTPKLTCFHRPIKPYRLVGTSSEEPEIDDASEIATEIAQQYEENKEKIIPPFPITSLPNELLCQILQIIIEPDHPHRDSPDIRKYQLVAVCRHWRDTILETPAFWTNIWLTPHQKKSIVKAHVERSHQLPLDITIFGFTPGRNPSFPALLKIVESTMHRWRSLTLPEQSVNNIFILQSLDHAVCPLLERFSAQGLVIYKESPCYPKFLCRENVPALRRLEMCASLTTSDDFRLPPTLERFALCIMGYHEGTFAFLQSPSLQGLKVLSLGVSTEHRSIQPNSIHLPLLTHFTCNVVPAEPLLQGLSTPNLTHLGYYQGWKENLTSVFNGIPSKWTNVRELDLRLMLLAAHYWPEDYLGGLMALYSAAPEVQHVEATNNDLSRLLGVKRGICPIDQWERLEKLTVTGDMEILNYMRKDIVPWLKRRRSIGKPAVKIIFILDPFPKSILEVKRENILNEIGEYCDGVDFYAKEPYSCVFPEVLYYYMFGARSEDSQ